MNNIECSLNILEQNEYIKIANLYYRSEKDTYIKAKKIISSIGNEKGYKFMKELSTKIEETNEYIIFNNYSSSFVIMSKKDIDEFLANTTSEETRIEQCNWQIHEYINNSKDYEIKSQCFNDVIYNKKLINKRKEEENNIEQEAIDLLNKLVV